MPEFVPFRKIPRLMRTCTITEKIDGTNACIYVEGGTITAGSRTRWITPQDDNYGFAKWVETNKEELLRLGDGYHFGEWWGAGIQRKYGLKERCFSLFNTHKWVVSHEAELLPKCCRVVPVIYEGPFSLYAVDQALSLLRTIGSLAAPGFHNLEGVVVYHHAASQYFKRTLEKDEGHKSA